MSDYKYWRNACWKDERRSNISLCGKFDMPKTESEARDLYYAGFRDAWKIGKGKEEKQLSFSTEASADVGLPVLKSKPIN